MTSIDEIEELRRELRFCWLTPAERRSAEFKLTELVQRRNQESSAEWPVLMGLAEADLPPPEAGAICNQLTEDGTNG